jgi:hypothetical protein
MRTARQTAAALDEFRAEHGQTINNALMLQSERMRRSATEIQAGYDRIKDDPEARARQDASMITTEYLRQRARMAQEAADRADAARQAWEELTRGED